MSFLAQPWKQLLLCYHAHLHSVHRNFSAVKKMKRFYKAVSISYGEDGYEINLDQRKLKTPLGNIFKVQQEPLAIAVATEWDSQQEYIERYAMHLTQLCNTAIDNPMRRTSEDIAQATLHYLDTDTVCYRHDEPAGLKVLEEHNWDPIVKWVENRYKVEIPCSQSIHGVAVPPHTKHVLYNHLTSHSVWPLIGYHQATEIVKSLVITLALIDRHITVSEAVTLSLLESQYQTERWGKVEWSHDVSEQEMLARLAAAILFTHVSSHTSLLIHKLNHSSLTL